MMTIAWKNLYIYVGIYVYIYVYYLQLLMALFHKFSQGNKITYILQVK